MNNNNDTWQQKDKTANERRGKILRIPYYAVLTAFGKSNTEHPQLSTYIDLPKQWYIGGVTPDFTTGSFLYLIYSPDYPQVAEGAEYPAIPTKTSIS